MAVRRVGVFGGTFDPVHEGHVHVAEQCRERFSLDLVIFMPCRRSPHKEDAPEASDAERLQMLSLALAGRRWAIVSTLEVDRAPPSFSWITAESLREVFPEAELVWLMGSDQWDVLHLWDRPEHFASLVEIVVFHRDRPPAPQQGFQARFLAGDHPASASAIRAALKSGAPPQWLDTKVEHFIREHGLYQGRT